MMNKKKILILGKLPPPYIGPSIATAIILGSALKDRFSLFHLDTKVNLDIPSFGKWNFKKIGKNISLYSQMYKMCRRIKPDLVLVPISQTTVGFIKDSFFILMARMAGSKVVVQLRGSNFKNWISASSSFVRAYVKFILRKTEGCIVLGNNLKHLFESYFSPENIFVVPNGGDYNIPQIAKDQKEVKLIYLSNLLSSKGIEDVFEAIKILNEKTETKNKFSVDFIGEWYKEDTKKYCLELNAKHRLPVRIQNSEGSKDKLNYLAAADIFVFPPREPEGHPWAIVEAMAAGLPVVSTDMGAIKESVINEVNGYIVKPKQPEMLAAKLAELINNKDLREKMGERSRNLYLQNFTEEKMVENLSAVFNSIIQK